MTAPACIHGCDGVWIDTPSGLMPCPRHSLTAHQEWASGKYRPTGPAPLPPPEPNPDTTEAGLAAARAALTRKQDPPA